MKSDGTPKGAYLSQRDCAKHRGIEWGFTFETWWAMWERSGKWEKRGRRKYEYQMLRNGDRGPYSPDNCRIGTKDENHAEWFKRDVETGKFQDRCASKFGVVCVSPNGLRYPSYSHAARAAKVSATTIRNWCRDGLDGWSLA